MQFAEPKSQKTTCPVCGKEVVLRSLRDTRSRKPSYCSRVCASQARYNTRYQGSLSGPMDRPTLLEKTKLSQPKPVDKV